MVKYNFICIKKPINEYMKICIYFVNCFYLIISLWAYSGASTGNWHFSDLTHKYWPTSCVHCVHLWWTHPKISNPSHVDDWALNVSPSFCRIGAWCCQSVLWYHKTHWRVIADVITTTTHRLHTSTTFPGNNIYVSFIWTCLLTICILY